MDLRIRDHLVRGHAELQARGTYDSDVHGPADTVPLTVEDRLKLLALGEHIVRAPHPGVEIDRALQAGATWSQLADALGAGHDDVRQRRRSR